jgi:hypothetical protein
MNNIADLTAYREIKSNALSRKMHDDFCKEVHPGSLVTLMLDGKIYWDLRTGKLAEKPDCPNNWPLYSFAGYLVPHWNSTKGPKLSPFPNPHSWRQLS